MLHRDSLEVGDTLNYLPGGVEVKVVDLSSYWVTVQDPDGSLHEVAPDELSLYEPTSMRA